MSDRKQLDQQGLRKVVREVLSDFGIEGSDRDLTLEIDTDHTSSAARSIDQAIMEVEEFIQKLENLDRRDMDSRDVKSLQNKLGKALDKLYGAREDINIADQNADRLSRSFR